MLNQYKDQFNIVTVLMTTLILLAFIFSAYRAWQMRHGKSSCANQNLLY